jgi:hypothetical protein
VRWVGKVDLSGGGHSMGVNSAIKGNIATKSTNNSEQKPDEKILVAMSSSTESLPLDG